MVVRLKTKRAALLLYAVLLVLPTVVLGGLHWHQLWLDYDAERAAVPEAARDAARRLADGIAERLGDLLESEESRGFHEYARILAPGDELGSALSLHPSPLLSERLPEGVLAWFSYNLSDGYDAEVGLFRGRSEPAADDHPASGDDLEAAARRLLGRSLQDGFLRRAARLGLDITPVRVPLVVAAVHRGQTPEELECIRQHMPDIANVYVPIHYGQFHLRFYVEDDGTPRAVASRRVMFAELDDELVERVPCLKKLSLGFGLEQGVFLDPRWLFEELPVWVSDRVLSGSERFVGEGAVEGAPTTVTAPTEFRFPVSLVRALGFETEGADAYTYGEVNVVMDEGEIQSRFRAQSWRFFGVAAMLALTLGTGILLLLRSVTSDLQQAEQTENFVAAVTHELRTPLSAIRLHGEMLQEGWVSDEDKRNEYYSRIVRETSRLSTLVERVLEKSRLSSGAAAPEPGELSVLVERLRTGLEERAADDDFPIEFDLSPALPPILLIADAVAGILDNLVENARKYARDADGKPAGPILVRTALVNGQVALEVADRGPGVPADEAERVFEAFYRIGNEATRTSRGTGLGLHLVALHADSMNAKVGVHEREGGGALFRVTFQKA